MERMNTGYVGSCQPSVSLSYLHAYLYFVNTVTNREQKKERWKDIQINSGKSWEFGKAGGGGTLGARQTGGGESVFVGFPTRLVEINVANL
jgi:hypothetical protein